MGHMKVMWYVSMFDQAGWQLVAAIGLPASRLRELGRCMAAVHQELTYRRELYPGDAVHICTEVVEVNGHYGYTTACIVGPVDDIAAEMAFVAVHLDTTERKAVALPPAVIEHARALGRRADSIACADPCALSKA
jgi:acyl-CoA thioester hydrolase